MFQNGMSFELSVLMMGCESVFAKLKAGACLLRHGGGESSGGNALACPFSSGNAVNYRFQAEV